jgi:hypothetical protein
MEHSGVGDKREDSKKKRMLKQAKLDSKNLGKYKNALITSVSRETTRKL